MEEVEKQSASTSASSFTPSDAGSLTPSDAGSLTPSGAGSPSQVTLKHLHIKDDFIIMKLIAEGGYGKVYQCRSVLDGNIYAIKQIGFDVKDLETKIREVQILSKMDHPNVLRYYQAWVEKGCKNLDLESNENSSETWSIDEESTDKKKIDEKSMRCLYILTEYCPKTLKDLLVNTGGVPIPIPIAEVYTLFKQIAEGLAYVHGKGVIHRDISRANIFIDKSNNVKIGDFGLAIIKGEAEEITSSNYGNLVYLAPEIDDVEKLGSLITTKVDTYALGLLLVEMAYHMATDGERSIVLKKIREDRQLPDVDPHFYELCEQLVARNPSDRLSAAEALTELKNVEI